VGRHLAVLPEEVPVKTVGLIVNPIAGLGGRVGLKGTDGVADEALRRGAVPAAADRAAAALRELLPLRDSLLILCPAGEMGEALCSRLGFTCKVVSGCSVPSSAADTAAAARAMGGAELLLFAGGDGTARDIAAAGWTKPSVGIPAGVKIHSPVYAVRPEAAGRLALRYLTGRCAGTREAEVVDIDEDAYRAGRVSTSLYGCLTVPDDRDLLQHGKAPSPASERSLQRAIAEEMRERMKPGVNYLIGPGTTTKTLMELLGLPNTLLGVDLIRDGALVQADLSEADILRSMAGHETHLILTPTGGQGSLLGRGNQQLSAAVLRGVGTQRLHILATQEKLFALSGRPLLVDTGDNEVDRAFSGYARVIVGYHEEQMIRISGESKNDP